MSKNGRIRHGAFSVDPDGLCFTVKPQGSKREGMTIKQALQLSFSQMKISGRRPRTIESYDYIFNDFFKRTSLEKGWMG